MRIRFSTGLIGKRNKIYVKINICSPKTLYSKLRGSLNSEEPEVEQVEGAKGQRDLRLGNSVQTNRSLFNSTEVGTLQVRLSSQTKGSNGSEGGSRNLVPHQYSWGRRPQIRKLQGDRFSAMCRVRFVVTDMGYLRRKYSEYICRHNTIKNSRNFCTFVIFITKFERIVKKSTANVILQTEHKWRKRRQNS